jgi:predicted nucleic acid-binding Zn ribbon protein
VRRRAPRPLAVAVGSVVESLAPATTLARVQSAWAGAAGEAIAAEATPVSERDGVLHLRCRSAVWAQEVELLAPDLVERLNAALGGPEIGAIRASTGPM